ncbi:hypothetical protein NC651_022598, partial [Populus alba x Populus x berolinensis]
LPAVYPVTWCLSVSWFQLECVVNYEEDVTSFLLVEKAAENFFVLSTHHYVYNKKFSNPFVVTSPMIAELSKSFIFQLRFGASMAGGNRCDMVVYKDFDDVPRSALSKLSQQPNSLATPIVVAALPDSTPPPPHSPVTPASVVSH